MLEDNIRQTFGINSHIPLLIQERRFSLNFGQNVYNKSDNLLDGSPQNLKMFLERLASRVIMAGWKTITKVDGRDHLMQYSNISISDCKTAAQGYLKLDKDGEIMVNKQS